LELNCSSKVSFLENLDTKSGPTRVLLRLLLSITPRTLHTLPMSRYSKNFANTRLLQRSSLGRWVEENGAVRRVWKSKSLYIGWITSSKRGASLAIFLQASLEPFHRYPTFVDAVRDIDDALCMIFLFASLPSTANVAPSLVENCARLAAEWQLYVMHTHSLRKVFLSIKGVYYQAEVFDQTVTWLVPYQFTQNVFVFLCVINRRLTATV
jgi:hypothetical protein